MESVSENRAKGLLQLRHGINAHKALTPVVVVLLMFYFRNWSSDCWIYLALHGCYCACWILKDATFPDPQWEQPASFAQWLTLVIMLGIFYWTAPFVLVGGWSIHSSADPLIVGLSVMLTQMGFFLHYCSDCQKSYTLRVGGKRLIDNGLFCYSRNPNYLGEMLIYAGN